MTKTYSTTYEHMEFPPYKWQEYPKVVRRSLGFDDKGKEIFEEHIVANQREELNFLADVPAPAVQSERDELAEAVRARDQKIAELEAMLMRVQSTGEAAPPPAPPMVSKVPLPKSAAA